MEDPNDKCKRLEFEETYRSIMSHTLGAIDDHKKRFDNFQFYTKLGAVIWFGGLIIFNLLLYTG